MQGWRSWITAAWLVTLVVVPALLWGADDGGMAAAGAGLLITTKARMRDPLPWGSARRIWEKLFDERHPFLNRLIGNVRGSFRIPLQALTYGQLAQLTSPLSGQPEALPWILFHTKTYTDNSTTSLLFFDAVESDKSLGNLEQAGTLAHPQYFRIYNMGLDVLREVTTTAGGITGAADDVHRLVLTGRGYWTLTIASKTVQGPFPVSFLHTSGGVNGFTAGTWTAEENITWALNSIPDGGWHVGGSITIPPKEAFSQELRWPAAIDLTADARLRSWMAGVIFRKVN